MLLSLLLTAELWAERLGRWFAPADKLATEQAEESLARWNADRVEVGSAIVTGITVLLAIKVETGATGAC
jgi:hypothetical protein